MKIKNLFCLSLVALFAITSCLEPDNLIFLSDTDKKCGTPVECYMKAFEAVNEVKNQMKELQNQLEQKVATSEKNMQAKIASSETDLKSKIASSETSLKSLINRNIGQI